MTRPSHINQRIWNNALLLISRVRVFRVWESTDGKELPVDPGADYLQGLLAKWTMIGQTKGRFLDGMSMYRVQA